MKIYKFSAEWCSPCRALSQKISEWGRKDLVKEVDVDENEDLTDKYHIHTIPTLVLVDENGAELRRLCGNVSLSKLDEFVDGDE